MIYIESLPESSSSTLSFFISGLRKKAVKIRDIEKSSCNPQKMTGLSVYTSQYRATDAEDIPQTYKINKTPNLIMLYNYISPCLMN